MTRHADQVAEQPLRTLGWGLGTFLVVLAAALAVAAITLVLAMVTGLLTLSRLVGLIMVLGATVDALLGIVLWLTVVFAAPLIVSLAVGRRLFSQTPAHGLGALTVPLAAGLGLIMVLRGFPS